MYVRWSMGIFGELQEMFCCGFSNHAISSHVILNMKSVCAGLFADNLLMDMVVDKQLSTQFSVQSECDTHPSHSEHEDNNSEKDGSESESESETGVESESNKRRARSNICGIVFPHKRGFLFLVVVVCQCKVSHFCNALDILKYSS